MRALLLGLVGCNLTPTPWPDPSVAPGGRAPWSHPTDRICRQRQDPGMFEVDGFLFCGDNPGLNKVPIDDPVYVACADATLDERVMAVFDGTRARAYALRGLYKRELVNDDWDGEPLLVDY
ncbi:MAG: DUF3179 domain-containing (seleno)protein [Myxococcota bacterium]